MARGQPTPEVGRRVRAAIVLATQTQEDVPRFKAHLAAELNISPRTLERALLGRLLLSDWEIRRLAELLAVPEWFLRDGFEGRATEPVTGEGGLLEKFEELRRSVEARLPLAPRTDQEDSPELSESAPASSARARPSPLSGGAQ